MDLIYAEHDHSEKGILRNYDLDYEAASEVGKNTFEIQHPLTDNQMDVGNYWYIQDTEYGGRVDSTKIDTSDAIVYYGGRTWRGMLESKIVCPDSGADYLTLSGDLNAIVQTLISRSDLDDVFDVATTTTMSVKNWQFFRYENLYSELMRLLSTNGYKLTITNTLTNGKIVPIIEAKAITDWDNEMEIGSDLFDFTLKKDHSYPNHIIGLGAGDLKDRLVIHRYLDAHNHVSKTQVYSGEDDITEIYDYGNAQDEDDLIEKTEEHLLDGVVEDNFEISANDIEADIGDSFTAVAFTAGISVTQYVTNKIATITEDDISIQYKVGSSVI